MHRSILAAGTAAAALLTMGAAAAPSHDLIVRGGTIYDGSGAKPFVGDVAVDGDRISYVGPHADGVAKTVIDARGQAVSPGFINMLSWSVESLLIDGKS